MINFFPSEAWQEQPDIFSAHGQPHFLHVCDGKSVEKHGVSFAALTIQCCEPEIAAQMKQMDFFARPGADPQPYGGYGKANPVR
ncbi:MAG: hypothetical protein WA108_02410 [Thiobacillus sp.]|jgi:hypothetical protein